MISLRMRQGVGRWVGVLKVYNGDSKAINPTPTEMFSTCFVLSPHCFNQCVSLTSQVAICPGWFQLARPMMTLSKGRSSSIYSQLSEEKAKAVVGVEVQQQPNGVIMMTQRLRFRKEKKNRHTADLLDR